MTDDKHHLPSEAELLAEFGRELLGESLGFGSQDPARFRRFASDWIEQRNDEIRDLICGNEDVQRIFDKPVQDRLNDGAMVADLLMEMKGGPPVLTLALVLLRRGREAVCGA